MKIYFVLVLLIHFSFSITISNAQSPAIEWQKCLGGGNGDYAHAIEPTSDGGYIVAGYTGSNDGDITRNQGNNDFWVIKFSSSGTIEWQKTLGGNSIDQATAIHQTTDGGYVVSGNSTSNNGDVTTGHSWSMDYWIVKLSSTGDIQWQKSLGGNKNDYTYAMQLTADGGYVLAGHSESNDGDVSGNHGDRDYWVVKLNSTGAIQWQKSLGGSGDDEAYSVQVTKDGGYIVAGFTESNDGNVTGHHGKRDYWVVKLTNTGAMEWQKSLGGSSFEEAWSVQQTTDGGYIVAGYSSSNDYDVSGNHHSLGPFSDYWVVKLRNNGSIEWQKCLGGNFNEHAFAISLTPDGGYIVAGFAESANGDATCNAGYEDYWVVKLNNVGTIQWQKSMGGNNFDEAYAVQPSKDGGYIIAGFTGSTNINGYHPNTGSEGGDCWIIKLSNQITSLPTPEVTISTTSTSVCSGTPITFTATPVHGGTIVSYQWQVNNSTVGNNSPIYTPNSLTNGDKVSCMMTSNAGCEYPTYTVASNVITMQGNDITPEVIISASEVVICEGTPVTFTAFNKSGNPNPTYQWSVNGVSVGTNSTTYTTSALTNNAVVQCRMTVPQCIGTTKDDSNPITIAVKPSLKPNITISASSVTICEGSPVTFTAKIIDGGAVPVYQWKVNGVTTGNNSAAWSASTLADRDVISCLLIPDVSGACSNVTSVASNSIPIKVSKPSAATISITASERDICEGKAVTFTATAQNAGASPVYQWQWNGNKAGNNSTIFTTSNLKDGDQINCILADNNAGCSIGSSNASNTITIRVRQVPTIMIHPSDTTIMSGTQIPLTAIVTGAIASFNWSPATELVDAQLLTPVTIPLQNETVYKLQVAAANGCEGSKEAIVKVVNQLYMPNSFTPNRDGNNDIFRIPVGVSLQLKEFTVFDRWGHRVFTTKDVTKGWDGTFNGTALDANTYVYMITGWDKGKEVALKGTVTLLR